MKNTVRLAKLATMGGLSMLTVGLLAAPASASPAPRSPDRAGAVFVQTDDPSGNSVLAYTRSADGQLTEQSGYGTGGLGGVLAGSVVDHTASQGSLQYDRERGMLYVTNAGSNTITSFAVRGAHLYRSQVIASGGSFPVSIAIHGDALYVLNARDGGSVQGFLRLGDRLVSIPQWHRALSLDATATPEFTHTPGQVAITPDGEHLLVTTKANTNAVDTFALDRWGGIAATPVVSTLPGAVPFAITFGPGGTLVLAEAGTNSVATFTVGSDGVLAPLDTALTGQAATCWVAGTGRHVYASNAGSGSLSGYRVGRSGNLTALGNTATDPGTVDAAASSDGNFLYVQAGRAGQVDEFAVDAHGALLALGSVTVPNGAGAEGIAAS
jgi:6-phosphogluconolactonase (cycloisomerase 2 family)